MLILGCAGRFAPVGPDADRGPGPYTLAAPICHSLPGARPVPDRSPFLLRLIFRPFHPQPPSSHFPVADFARYFIPTGCRVYPPGRPFRSRDVPVARSGVHHWLAGSPTGLAEAGSLSYGLVVHLLLLSTTHRCVAVAFGYRPESVYLERTFTSLSMRAFRRTILPLRGKAHKTTSVALRI